MRKTKGIGMFFFFGRNKNSSQKSSEATHFRINQKLLKKLIIWNKMISQAKVRAEVRKSSGSFFAHFIEEPFEIIFSLKGMASEPY